MCSCPNVVIITNHDTAVEDDTADYIPNYRKNTPGYGVTDVKHKEPPTRRSRSPPPAQNSCRVPRRCTPEKCPATLQLQ